MSIDIERIGSFLEACEDRSRIVAEFKKQFPGVSLTRCDSQDMSGEIPFKSIPGFDLHLVDGRDHCWKITQEAADATGVVLAERRK
ncbi:MAG: hypothetical protein K2P57_11390 [Burkholderiales bacterium]|nr:hypothetical protein [Burkholderiales bacterium]